MEVTITEQERKISHYRKSLRLTIACLLAAAVVALAFVYGSQLTQVLRAVDLRWVGAGALCYGLNYVLRAQRFRTLSRLRVRVWPEGLHTACLHGFATYMLPFRSGELTLPVILRSVSDLNLMEGSALLVRARLLDLKIMGLLAIGAALVTDASLAFSIRASWLGIGAVLILIPPFISWLAIKGHAARIPVVRRISAGLDKAPFTLGEMILSLGIWFSVAGGFFCVAQSIGLPLSLTQVWLLITIQLPLQLLPVQGLANAGNHEGGWVAGLLLLGMPLSAALEFALASHAILLLYVIGLGPAAFVIGLFVTSDRPAA